MGVRRAPGNRFVALSLSVLLVASAARATAGQAVDPAIAYATYAGGAGDERVVATETNSRGDVYVFGSGMDYRGYWRSLAGIYAVAERA